MNKTITVKDKGIKKEFQIVKMFANDALIFANILTNILPDDEENVRYIKGYLDVIFQNGEIPEEAAKANPDILKFDYIEMLLQLVKKRYLVDGNFIEQLLKNTIYINGSVVIGNISLINNKTEANNINNILDSIPAIYSLIKEHLILNYQDFFLMPTKDEVNT